MLISGAHLRLQPYTATTPTSPALFLLDDSLPLTIDGAMTPTHELQLCSVDSYETRVKSF